MRIESVAAVAFGPLRGTSLHLSPQLTVIYGVNEAGKSSWHAALYAALCGMRRSKGKTAVDKEFARLHRPWSGDQWEVHARLRLDNGQRVELRQNLGELAFCTAVDADFGRDISEEIINEGTPDGTLWLGLDRDTFPRVACIRQADVLFAEDDASALQEQLQKAAASTARDVTAAQAIELLEEFQREHVGKEQANSTKPLQKAKRLVERASEELQRAAIAHGEWLFAETQAQQLRADADHKKQRLRSLLAMRAKREVAAWEVRLERARSIAAKFSGGRPAPLTDQLTFAQDVAAALHQWAQRVAVPTLDGESAAVIRAKIDALPALPDGDFEPAPELVQSKAAYDAARQAVHLHEQQQPAQPEASRTQLSPGELRSLAAQLETPVPAIDRQLETSYQAELEQLHSRNTTGTGKALMLAVATLSVALGVALWAADNRVLAVVFGTVGFGLVAFALRRPSAPANAQEMLSVLEVQLGSQRKAAEAAKNAAHAARARALAEQLPPNPDALRQLADSLVVAAERQINRDAWAKRLRGLQAECEALGNELLTGLQLRHQVVDAGLDRAFEQYVATCRSRAETAARAGMKPALQKQLQLQETAEKSAKDAEERNASVKERVLAVGRTLGVDSADVDHVAAQLKEWQQRHAQVVSQFDRYSREYAELEALLDGKTIQELEAKVSELAERAKSFGAAPGGEAEHLDQSELDEQVAIGERESQAANESSARAQATAEEKSKNLLSVAEAEEELERAQIELGRCRRLQSTLSETLRFLRAAEEKVHRDIAPALAAGLKQWLPIVTRDRYTDARVDPASLEVQVLGPDQQWREAYSLSRGTLEQIYLLLRIVLAARLVTTSESCPLILDDVLVHCDRPRKRLLLGALKEISRTQQVILFTQEEDVLQWAEQLPADQLIRLADPASVSTPAPLGAESAI